MAAQDPKTDQPDSLKDISEKEAVSSPSQAPPEQPAPPLVKPSLDQPPEPMPVKTDQPPPLSSPVEPEEKLSEGKVPSAEKPGVSLTEEIKTPVVSTEPVSPPGSEPPPPPKGAEELSSSFSFASPGRRAIKKIARILIIFLIILGIGGGIYYFLKTRQEGPTEEKTLVYWGLWEDGEILEEVIQDWEREYPQIKIEYVRKTKDRYREQLQSSLAREEGPDIFRFHSSWLPMFKEELSPLPSTVMEASQFEEAFYPVAVSDLKIGANIYGLPLEIDTLALFYNKEIFRAAGKSLPTTWDELRKLASELTVRDASGQIQIAGAAMGGAGNIDHWPDILGLMMLQNGVDLAKPKGELSRDRVWDLNFPSSTLAFAGGKLAMYFGYSWDVFEILRANESLDFGIAPMPQLPKREVINWASYWVEGVSKRSQNQTEAWQFLEFLSRPEELRKFYLAASKTRLFGEPYPRKEMASELIDDPLVGVFVKQAETARSWYLCSRTFDNGLNQAMIQYFEDAVNAVNQGAGAEDALDTASKGVAQILSRYQVSR
jgi:multiple sugar transport system substrate-binding protein